MLQATIKSCSSTEKTEQCFPFGLTPTNLLALEELLTSELQSVYTDVQGPFEELLASKDLPAKLNDLDAFMRSKLPRQDKDDLFSHMQLTVYSNGAHENDKQNTNLLPAQLVALKLAQPKSDALNRLRSQVEQLEWRNGQRTEELAAQRDALSRRLTHVRDTQRLYEEAMGQLLAAPSGEMETLVDRMVHQTVPNYPQ